MAIYTYEVDHGDVVPEIQVGKQFNGGRVVAVKLGAALSEASVSNDNDHSYALDKGVQKSAKVKKSSRLRRFFAATLDFFTITMVGGYAIAWYTGNLTDSGFSLSGGPAFLSFGVVVAYFVIGRKYLGGTIWQRILKAY